VRDEVEAELGQPLSNGVRVGAPFRLKKLQHRVGGTRTLGEWNR
jgi:hypothetical protein